MSIFKGYQSNAPNDSVTWKEIPEDTGLFNDTRISKGTSAILNQLYKWSTNKKRPTWDIFLVNILTIVRNSMEFKSDQDKSQVLKNALAELNVLTTYLSSYTSINSRDPEEPKVVFYYPTYKVPEIYLRPASISRDTLKYYSDQFDKHLVEGDTYFENLKVIYLKVGKRQLPHVELDLRLHEIDSKYKYRRICMISSTPMDYHFYKFVPNFHVFRSYTGEIYTRNNFHEMVFKNYQIPFNSYTHLLLGDSKMLKSPLTPKQKKTLEKISTDEKWKFKPEFSIQQSILNMNLVDRSYLKGLKI